MPEGNKECQLVRIGTRERTTFCKCETSHRCDNVINNFCYTRIKFYACDLNLLLDTGRSLGGAANNWRPTLRPNEERSEAREDHEEQPDAVKSERIE